MKVRQGKSLAVVGDDPGLSPNLMGRESREIGGLASSGNGGISMRSAQAERVFVGHEIDIYCSSHARI